jgi:pimeloyl-ACP methyl ester carboxylesterase
VRVAVDRLAAERRPGRRGRRLALVGAAVVAGLVLGVAIDVVCVGGVEAWLARRGGLPQYDVPPYDPRGRVIEVAGRGVYLDCRGSGSPTVVLEAGFGSGAGSWGHVLDATAAVTRTCAWDRPGIGRSEARGLHSGAETASDLRAALGAAGESGPYVVVAHSLGGVYARLFAAAGPVPGATPGDRDAVLGFVMIDAYEPDLGMDVDAALGPEVREAIRRSIDDTGAMIQGGEALDWAATMAELAPLGPVELPALVLSIDPALRYGEPDPDRLAALLDAWHRAVAARYPNGDLEIVPNTGHLIHLERPNLVIERIREVVLRHGGA